ncbi:unnamed protein product [Moneuplotes crassus]|uniref:CUB domain-containing protein n=1 Tax=Euplotes crassus TaxID=5936 RepID=A0AAD1XFQ0_EUPCR|nr:unnamed protein product [Moneuplotes crassus]
MTSLPKLVTLGAILTVLTMASCAMTDEDIPTETSRRALFYSNSPSDCRWCVDNTYRRWCTHSGTTGNSGQCCRSWETSGYCSSSGSYVCSNSSNIDSNGAMILCPTSSYDCETKDRPIYSTSSTSNIRTTYIARDSVCIYRITTTHSSIEKVEIDIDDLTNAAVTIFTGPEDQNSYTFQSTMTENDQKNFTLNANNDVYIVVEPSSSYNLIDIDYKAYEISTTTPTSTFPTGSSSSSESSSVGTIIGSVVIVVVICAVGVVVGLLIVFLCKKCRKTKCQIL